MSSFASTRRRAIVLLAAAVALGAALVACSATTAASPTGCRVRNVDSGVVKTSLQKAVWAAEPGDHLRVRGTCVGNTVVGKSLVVAGVRTPLSGQPTITGPAGASGSAVLYVKPVATVTLKELRVQGGTPCCGIVSLGTLVLRDVVVTENSYMAGGGIAVEGGRVTLKGTTTIRGNEGGWGGGASLGEGTRLVMLDSSVIRGNTALADGGGVVVGAGATLVMRDSSTIRGNVSKEGAGPAGGVASTPTSRLVGVVCAPATGANVYGNEPADCVTRTE
jgi:hypothetical protein